MSRKKKSGGRTFAMVAEVAKWRESGRHSDRSMEAIHWPKEAK